MPAGLTTHSLEVDSNDENDGVIVCGVSNSESCSSARSSSSNTNAYRVFYPLQAQTISSTLLVDTSEGLFNLLGQSIQVALNLLLARCVWVFEFHLRELEHDIGRCVSDLG